MNCVICGQDSHKIYEFKDQLSVTSLGRLIGVNATVGGCESCGHCQTFSSLIHDDYYANDYKSLSESEEEDDLYEIRHGLPIFRNVHMADVFINKNKDNLKSKTNILDYGCGKSLAGKYLNQHQSINLHLFDISSDYMKFWNSFLPISNTATFNLPNKWKGNFDIVCSFFSLEHTSNPYDFLDNVNDALKNDGIFYFIVPYMYSENIFDFMVVDHLQHFSETSVKFMLTKAGFEIIEQDLLSHKQAIIVIARKKTKQNRNVKLPKEESYYFFKRQCSIAAHWEKWRSQILCWQERKKRPVVIIGAGVIGSLVFSIIGKENVLCFIDSNKHKQSKGWLGVQVISTDKYNDSTEIKSKRPIFVIALSYEQSRKLKEVLTPNKIDVSDVYSPPPLTF